MQRFFVPPSCLESQPVVLTGDLAHQVRRVLRMRLGERVLLLDGAGWSYEAVLVSAGQADVRFQMVSRLAATGEPPLFITLHQAVLKGDHFSWALQKGVEVGVSRFAPLVCQRNVVDDLDAVEGKRERWQRVLREAAEQSGRGLLPQLGPCRLFAQAVQQAPQEGLAGGSRGLRLLLWEGGRELHIRDALARGNLHAGSHIELFVGPEGGFTPEEVSLARENGVQPVTLGPRILRAETAGVIAAALILYEAGER